MISIEVDDFTGYIEVTYIRGKQTRNCRPATPLKFPPKMWNVYDLF